MPSSLKILLKIIHEQAMSIFTIKEKDSIYPIFIFAQVGPRCPAGTYLTASGCVPLSGIGNLLYKIHEILNLRGVSGFDFIYDHNREELYLLEVNTHPGLTEFSLLPKVAKYHSIDYEDICTCIIEESLKQ
jgi:hypothetical protein